MYEKEPMCSRQRRQAIIYEPCLRSGLRLLLIAGSLWATTTAPAWAQAEPLAKEPSETPAPTQTPSPWLLLPTFTNSPKLGTSVGALGAYMKKFDAESQVSMFGVSAQYTSTDSAAVGAFARASFDADHHRLSLVAAGGVVKNDYDDFLGTGVPLKSEDHLRGFLGRYLYRVKDDWFVGVQAVATNYQIVGQSALDDDMLAILGLTGFEAGGIGLVLYHDSRDLYDSPKRGWVFNVNSIAYRQRIEGSNNFDVYRADYRHFWSHGEGHVFALRQSNQWTVDAPASAFAPVPCAGTRWASILARTCPPSRSRSGIASLSAGPPRSSAVWHACTVQTAAARSRPIASRASAWECSTSSNRSRVSSPIWSSRPARTATTHCSLRWDTAGREPIESPTRTPVRGDGPLSQIPRP